MAKSNQALLGVAEDYKEESKFAQYRYQFHF